MTCTLRLEVGGSTGAESMGGRPAKVVENYDGPIPGLGELVYEVWPEEGYLYVSNVMWKWELIPDHDGPPWAQYMKPGKGAPEVTVVLARGNPPRTFTVRER